MGRGREHYNILQELLLHGKTMKYPIKNNFLSIHKQGNTKFIIQLLLRLYKSLHFYLMYTRNTKNILSLVLCSDFSVHNWVSEGRKRR